MANPIDTIQNGESNLSVRLKLNALVGSENGSVAATLPNPIGYTGPSIILNEADGKVYRYVGGGWVADVAASDVQGQLQNAQIASLAAPKITGQLTDSQIASINGSKITGLINGSLVTPDSLDITKFASGIRPVEVVSALPGPPHTVGRIVFLITDSKLYRNNGFGWVATVPAADITGTITDAQLAGIAASKITGQLTNAQLADIAAAKISGQLTDTQIADIAAAKIVGQLVASQIADAVITTAKFASGLRPVEIVASLPSTGNFVGRIVMLTTDGKLYRYTGSGWTAAVPATDVTGQLTNAQIADLAAAKISGQLTNNQLADIAASKLIGQVTSAQIAALDASKIAGQLTDAQIAALAASKLSGQLTNSQIADIAAAKITGQLVASQISDAAITTAKFANGIRPIEVVSSLPSTGNVAGRVVVLTTDGKLYRYTGSAWTAAVPAVDVTGQLTNSQIADIAAAKVSGQLTNAQIADIDAAKLTGQVIAAQIASGAITLSKFGTGLAPVEIVGTLPASGNFAGRTVFLTTDNKLYRHNGTAFISNVPAGDITGTLSDAQIAAVAASKVTGQLTNSQIADVAASKMTGQITSTQITDNAITTPKIFAGAITTAKIAAGAVTADEIASNAITAVKINAGAITTAKIAAGAITANEIASGAIVAGKIAANAVTANELAADSVVAGKIAAGAVTATELAANAVTAGAIAAGAITTGKIASGAVTANEIAANAITAVKIAAGAITAGKIAAGAVTAAEIAAGTITADKFAAGAISAGSIEAGSVTADKLASNAVIAGKIAAGAVSTAELAAGAVTASKLFVGDTSNMVEDWSVGNTEGWTIQGQQGFVFDSGNSGSGGWRIQSNERDQGFSKWLPVTPGEIYYLAAWVFNSHAATASVMLHTTDSLGNNPVYIVAATTNAKDTWTRLQGQGTIPAGATRMRMLLQTNRTAGSGGASTYWTKPLLRRAASGELIVDGSIIATKIAADAVTTSKIAAGAVTANEIAANAIVSGKIAAGTITAGELAAGAVTTSKLAVGSANNLINNTAFWQGLDTWTSVVANANTATLSLRPPGQSYAGINYPTLMAYQPDANNVGYLDIFWKRAGTPDGAGNWGDRIVPATPGQRYEVSIQATSLRCTSELRLFFLSSSGTVSYSSTAASIGTSSAPTSDPDSWERYLVRDVAPANTVGVGIHIRKLATSSGTTSYLFMHKPLLTKALVNATEATEWSEGGTTIISGGGIATGAILASHVSTNAITANAIAAGAVVAGKIAANAVTANEIAANAVTAVKVSAGAITAGKIAANAVTANEIAADSVTTAKIAAGAVTANEIAANAVTAGKIAANAVTAGTIVAGAITATEIAVNAIAARHLLITDWENLVPDNQLQDPASWGKSNTTIYPASTLNFTSKGMAVWSISGVATDWEEILNTKPFGIVSGQEYFVSFQAAKVGTNNIANAIYRIEWLDANGNPFGSSLYTDIATGVISSTSPVTYNTSMTPPAQAFAARVRVYVYRTGTTLPASAAFGSFSFLRKANGNLIVDGAVTAAKIQAGAIVTGKIAAGAVTANEIATDAITAVKISAGAITTVKIAANAITANELAANSITTPKIAAGAVVSASIAAGEVKASNIAAGAVTAGKIAALSITSAELAADSVVAGKIAAGAISAAQIAAGAITSEKIAAGAIIADNIQANTITAVKIVTGTVENLAYAMVSPSYTATFSQTIPNSTYSTITNYTTAENNLGDATFVNGIFTVGANTAGLWAIMATGGNVNSGSEHVIQVTDNNGTALGYFGARSNAGSPSGSVCVIIRRTAGQGVNIACRSIRDGGGSMQVLGRVSFIRLGA